jgi:hypothetical protein
LGQTELNRSQSRRRHRWRASEDDVRVGSILLKKDFERGLRATLIQGERRTSNIDLKLHLLGFDCFKLSFHSLILEPFSTLSGKLGLGNDVGPMSGLPRESGREADTRGRLKSANKRHSGQRASQTTLWPHRQIVSEPKVLAHSSFRAIQNIATIQFSSGFIWGIPAINN